MAVVFVKVTKSVPFGKADKPAILTALQQEPKQSVCSISVLCCQALHHLTSACVHCHTPLLWFRGAFGAFGGAGSFFAAHWRHMAARAAWVARMRTVEGGVVVRSRTSPT